MFQPRDTDWLNGYKKKIHPYICFLQKTHFRPRDTYRLKVRGWKKIFHANGNQKKAGVAILISDKIDFKIKNGNIRQRRSLYNDKGVNSLRVYKIENTYAANIRAAKYIKEILTN